MIEWLQAALGAVASLVESIPAPAFLANGLGTYLNGIDPAVIYFLSRYGKCSFSMRGYRVRERVLKPALPSPRGR